MSYCFNPYCCQPDDRQADLCSSCGTSLLLKGRYRGVKLLGKSQLALTIEATEIASPKLQDAHQDDRRVVKILLSNYPKAIALFQQEAQILGQITHDGIPQLADNGYFNWQPQGSENQLHCLVTNKIPGIDLEQWFKQRERAIDERLAKQWLKQILDILAQIHSAEYFHRDIKPANIILQPDGKLALIDFGAARKISATYLGKVGVRRGVTSIGTPGYIAPEQIDGAALPQSDFFALGRTLVHLLTGKHPQELPKDPNTGELIWRDRAVSVSDSFADLLDAMMDRLPGKRPINIAAIESALIHSSKPAFTEKFRLKRLLPLLLGAIAIPSLLSLFSLGQKTAEATLCQNLTCVNRDPIDNKCDKDAQTITSNIGNYRVSQDFVKAYRLEIRYSPACQATWARTEAPPDSTHYLEDDRGQKYGTAVVPVDQFQEHYADMGPGKNIRIRACAEPPQSEKRCTNFVRL